MERSSALVATLKQELKSRGLTYRDVAARLGLSETSVKRMFSTGNFTLKRLDAVCEMMGLGLTDLIHLMDQNRQRITHLTEAQEAELVGNLKLLLVAVCARNNLSFEEIVARYAIEPTECIHLLARLDRLQLIELLPGNRYRLLVTPEFRWLPGGPVERYFEETVQREFLDGRFDQEGALRLFLSAPLSQGSIATLRRRLEAVAAEFQDLMKADARLPAAERQNIGMGLMLRPWELAAFAALRRHPV